MAKPRVLTPEQESEVVELIKDGMRQTDIAKLYEVGVATVQQIRVRYGIPAREKKEKEEGEWKPIGAWENKFCKEWNEVTQELKKRMGTKDKH